MDKNSGTKKKASRFDFEVLFTLFDMNLFHNTVSIVNIQSMCKFKYIKQESSATNVQNFLVL